MAQNAVRSHAQRETKHIHNRHTNITTTQTRCEHVYNMHITLLTTNTIRRDTHPQNNNTLNIKHIKQSRNIRQIAKTNVENKTTQQSLVNFNICFSSKSEASNNTLHKGCDNTYAYDRGTMVKRHHLSGA